MASRKFPQPPSEGGPDKALGVTISDEVRGRLYDIWVAVDMIGDDIERIADALEALVVVQASGLSLPSQRERAVEMVMRVATRSKKP